MKRILIIFASIFIIGTLLSADEAKKDDSGEQKISKTEAEYIADLSSDDEDTVLQAADWLGKEEKKAAVTKLKDLLGVDKRIKVRMYAAIALGLIKDENSIESLNDALLIDQNVDVRYAVLLAISRIGSSKSIDALRKAKEIETDPFIKDFFEKMEEKERGK